MKTRFALTFAAFAVATSAASAANIVFSFGAGDPSATQTINRVATTGASGVNGSVSVADALTTTGAPSGISTTATGNQWFSQGAGGSFAPVGSVAFTGSNALIDRWTTTYGPTNVGNIWQQGANGDNSTSSLTFIGLAANTNYTFTLLSARANGFLTDSGTYALTYNGDTT